MNPYDVIDDYIDNTLTPDERTTFEAAFERDAALAKAVAKEHLLRQTLQSAYRNERKATWTNAYTPADAPEATLDPDTATTAAAAPAPRLALRRYNWSIIGIAALLAVGMVAGIGWYMRSLTPDTAQLFAQNAQPEILDVGATMGTDPAAVPDSIAAFRAAVQEYNDHHYLEAAAAFAALSPSATHRTDEGICLFQAARYDEAAAIFKTCSTDAAFWYLALDALRRKNTAAAKQYLERIDTTDADYYERAQVLRAKL